MTFITTNSGRRFSIPRPAYESVCIHDIAHALSNLCRFNGHIKTFYSVAQHSVLVSLLVPPKLRFQALLHDAHEAYIGDMPTPWKDAIAGFREREDELQKFVLDCFGITSLAPEVKQADLVMLATERRDLLTDDGADWPCLQGIEPHIDTIYPWSQETARIRFLAAFEDHFSLLLNQNDSGQ